MERALTIMGGRGGGFHHKGKIYQQDLVSWFIQGRLKLLDVMLVLKLHNACTNQLPSSLIFGGLYPSCWTGSS